MGQVSKSIDVLRKPKHSLLTSQKTLSDYFKPTAQYYVKQSDYNSAYMQELHVLYNAAQGIVDHTAYNYVLNPTNTANAQFTRYPAQLRNFDIIGPVLNLFLGETSRRPNNPTVIAPSADSESLFKAKKAEHMKRLIAQDFVNALNGQGIQTGVESKPIPDYKSAATEFEESYDDQIAIIGQEALNYLVHALKMDTKIMTLMYDWLVCGRVFTYKNVLMNDVMYVVCDPRDIIVHGLPEGGLAEDAQAIVYRRRMTKADIIDEYNEELENKNENGVKLLDVVEQRDTTPGITLGPSIYSRTDSYGGEYKNPSVNEDKLYVYIVCWQGLKKIGKLTYEDPTTGQIVAKEVDDTYKFDASLGDIDIEWEWVNHWYTCEFLEELDLVLRYGEGLVQRGELNNNATNKLPFNGKFRGYRTQDIKSVVKTGLNYNILYNIVHFRFEFTLAKYRNKMTAFPFGLIPKKEGWDEDKWFYWGNVHDFLFYDETAPNASAAIQGIKDVGGTVANYIQDMWAILGNIRQEWWDDIGVNRQRLGDTMASDGKGVNDMAVSRSSLMTEDMFLQFDKFLESEYEGMLDVSKMAWIDGKHGSYLNSAGRTAFINIEPVDILGTQFGVFVKNTREEYEKLERGRNMLQTMGQNGLRSDGMMEVLDSNNFSKLKRLVKRAVQVERDFEAQAAQADRENNMNIQQMKSADAAQASADKRYVADAQAGATVRAAEIKADIDLQGIVQDTFDKRNEHINSLGQERVDALESRVDYIKNDLQGQQIDLARKGLDVKMFSDATKLKIARENRNRHDK